MFSNNGKISNHQAIRLLILDVFTGACLFLPMVLSRLAGNGGFLALILGLLLTLADGAVLSCVLKSVQASSFKTSAGDGLPTFCVGSMD